MKISWKNSTTGNSLLIKRKTKQQNEQKQTNLEKQKNKTKLTDTIHSSSLSPSYFFFSTFILASATP